MLGAGAAASVIVLVGAAAPVREAIHGMSPPLVAAALTLVLFGAWNGALIVRALAIGASLLMAAVLPHKLAVPVSRAASICRRPNSR